MYVHHLLKKYINIQYSLLLTKYAILNYLRRNFKMFYENNNKKNGSWQNFFFLCHISEWALEVAAFPEIRHALWISFSATFLQCQKILTWFFFRPNIMEYNWFVYTNKINHNILKNNKHFAVPIKNNKKLNIKNRIKNHFLSLIFRCDCSE